MRVLTIMGGIVGLGILAWGSWTCKDNVTGTDISQIVFPDSNVSYGKQVEPLFLRACAIPQCHTSDTRAGDLSLETYSDAMERVDVIVPKHPEVSLLVLWINGSRTPQMPIGLPPLNANQIHGISQWILEGAQNN